MSQLFSPMQSGAGGGASLWRSAGQGHAEPAGGDRRQWSSALTQSLQPVEKDRPAPREGAVERVARTPAEKTQSKAVKESTDPADRSSEESTTRETVGQVAEEESSSDEASIATDALAAGLIVAQIASPQQTSGPANEMPANPGNAGQAGMDVAAMQELLASQSSSSEEEGQQPGSQGQQPGGHNAQAMTQLTSGVGQEESAAATSSAGTKPLQAMQPASADAAVLPVAGAASASGAEASTGRVDAASGPAMLQGMDDLSSEEMDPNVARVAQGLRGAINLKGGAVTIRLNPAELGLVRIEMEIQGGSVRAELQAENASVRDLLTHQLGRLRETLQGRGLAVERLEVTPPGASDASQSGRGEQDAPGDGRSRGQFFNQQQSSQQREQGGERGRARTAFGRLLVDMVG